MSEEAKTSALIDPKSVAIDKVDALIGSEDDRKEWTKDQYAQRIKVVASGGAYALAVMLSEVKERHYPGKYVKGWREYVEKKLNMNYSYASRMLRIAKEVIPFIEVKKAQELGFKKMEMISKIKDEKVKQKILKSVDPKKKESELKKQLKPYLPGKSEGRRLMSPESLAKKIMDIDDKISDMLPYSEDSDKERERKIKNLKGIRERVKAPFDSLCNILNYILNEPETSELLNEKIPTPKKK